MAKLYARRTSSFFSRWKSFLKPSILDASEMPGEALDRHPAAFEIARHEELLVQVGLIRVAGPRHGGQDPRGQAPPLVGMVELPERGARGLDLEFTDGFDRAVAHLRRPIGEQRYEGLALLLGAHLGQSGHRRTAHVGLRVPRALTR